MATASPTDRREQGPTSMASDMADTGLDQKLEQFKRVRDRLVTEVGQRIIGQRAVVDQMLATVFVGGHCLLVGVPGLAKTLMVRSLAGALDLSFKRLQFTPDLMPSDITGTDLVDQAPDGRRVRRRVGRAEDRRAPPRRAGRPRGPRCRRRGLWGRAAGAAGGGTAGSVSRARRPGLDSRRPPSAGKRPGATACTEGGRSPVRPRRIHDRPGRLRVRPPRSFRGRDQRGPRGAGVSPAPGPGRRRRERDLVPRRPARPRGPSLRPRARRRAGRRAGAGVGRPTATMRPTYMGLSP